MIDIMELTIKYMTQNIIRFQPLAVTNQAVSDWPAGTVEMHLIGRQLGWSCWLSIWVIPAHIMHVEKRRGAGEPVLHPAWELDLDLCLEPSLEGRNSRRIDILSLSLCELAIYYTIKYIQTNKQTYSKNGSPYRYETCFLPNSSLSWSRPNICPIFATNRLSVSLCVCVFLYFF